MIDGFNLLVTQGSTFEKSITIKDRDITGYTGKSQIKRSYLQLDNVEFTINIYDPANGKIILSLTDDDTASLRAGRHLYDLFIISSSDAPEMVLDGIVTVRPRITVI